MLFIEAERMANGLYEPAECESERTVIISELQGGENDPEQLLDTEVTATAFRAHPYRHPTIGWLDDLQIDDARRSVRSLPPASTFRTMPRWSSSATSSRTRCCARVEQHSARSRRARSRMRLRPPSRRRSASAGC